MKNIFSLYISDYDGRSEIVVKTDKTWEQFIQDCQDICDESIQIQIKQNNTYIDYDDIFYYLRKELYNRPDYKEFRTTNSQNFNEFIKYSKEINDYEQS